MMKSIELTILRCFNDRDIRHFAEICKIVGLETDLGGYYLRSLVRQGVLARSGYGVYKLTVDGKRLLAVNKRHGQSISRPRVCALIVAKQRDRYAVLERAQQPFIGAQEWPAGSVRYGELADQAASRIVSERFGITGSPEYCGTFRRIDVHRGIVFDDKVFWIYTLALDGAQPISVETDWGKNQFYSADQLRQLSLPSKSLLDIFDRTVVGAFWSEERLYELSDQDLYAELSTDDA